MTDSNQHAANKAAVVANLRELLNSSIHEFDDVVQATYADQAALCAFHPVNDHTGAAAIGSALWRPIREAFPDAERRDQIVIGGEFDGADYVCTLSQIQGTFAQDWHGIPASHGVVSLSCGEVNRIENGKIVAAHVLIDLLDLMHQVGRWPLSPSLGAEGMWRSPATQDGVRLDTADPQGGAAALKIVKDMHEGLLAFDGEDLASMHHAQYWTKNFMWYGPSGIGTSRGLKGFEAHHQIPFLRAFPDRKVANHIANVSDGDYVITGGWPSVIATHTGPDWLNVGPTGKSIDMRVMDFYRLENGLIAENWVPIDIVHILLQMEVDVLARVRHLRGDPRTSL